MLYNSNEFCLHCHYNSVFRITGSLTFSELTMTDNCANPSRVSGSPLFSGYPTQSPACPMKKTENASHHKFCQHYTPGNSKILQK